MVNLLHIELLPSNPGPGWILTICTLVCAPTLWFSSDSIEVKLYRLLQLGAYIMALYFTSTIVIELRRTGPIDFLRRVLAWLLLLRNTRPGWLVHHGIVVQDGASGEADVSGDTLVASPRAPFWTYFGLVDALYAALKVVPFLPIDGKYALAHSMNLRKPRWFARTLPIELELTFHIEDAADLTDGIVVGICEPLSGWRVGYCPSTGCVHESGSLKEWEPTVPLYAGTEHALGERRTLGFLRELDARCLHVFERRRSSPMLRGALTVSLKCVFHPEPLDGANKQKRRFVIFAVAAALFALGTAVSFVVSVFDPRHSVFDRGADGMAAVLVLLSLYLSSRLYSMAQPTEVFTGPPKHIHVAVGDGKQLLEHKNSLDNRQPQWDAVRYDVAAWRRGKWSRFGVREHTKYKVSTTGGETVKASFVPYVRFPLQADGAKVRVVLESPLAGGLVELLHHIMPLLLLFVFSLPLGGALLITEHLSPYILDPLVQIVDPTVLPQLRRVANFTKKVMKA